MSETPEQIQRQIEDARAELASTVEQIADRVSPKKVAGRGAVAARAKVDDVFTKEVPAQGDGEHGAARTVRWERVGAVGGGVLLLLLLRRGAKKRRAGAPRRAALAAAAAAAAKARKDQAKGAKNAAKEVAKRAAKKQAKGGGAAEGEPPTAPTGRAAKRADRTRAELEAAVADLQQALAAQPTGD